MIKIQQLVIVLALHSNPSTLYNCMIFRHTGIHFLLACFGASHCLIWKLINMSLLFCFLSPLLGLLTEVLRPWRVTAIPLLPVYHQHTDRGGPQSSQPAQDRKQWTNRYVHFFINLSECNPMNTAGTNIVGLLQNIPSSLKHIMAIINGCIHNACQKWKITLLYCHSHSLYTYLCFIFFLVYAVYSISQSRELWVLGWTLTVWSGYKTILSVLASVLMCNWTHRYSALGWGRYSHLMGI